MKHLNKYLLIGILAAYLPCEAISQSYNYAVNSLNIPTLRQKGNANLSVGLASGLSFQAWELQSTYAPLPHLAIMANIIGDRNKEVRQKEKLGTDFYLWETGIGLYEQFSKGSASLFVGYGAGDLYSFYGSDRFASFHLSRWFLQPGLTYQSGHFQGGVALRLSRLGFPQGTVSYTIEPPDILYIQHVEKDGPFFLPEFGTQAGLRFKPVSVNMSFAAIFPDTSDWGFVRFNSCLSIAVEIGKR